LELNIQGIKKQFLYEKSRIKHKPQDPETHEVNQEDTSAMIHESRNFFLVILLGILELESYMDRPYWSSLVSYQKIAYCSGSTSFIQKAFAVSMTF